MADFDAHVNSGAVLTAWDDHASVGAPSRTNPISGRLHRYWKAAVGVEVEIHCTVAGVDAPLDTALGGRLFRASFAEFPDAGWITPTSPAGHSSIVRFTPGAVGHYLVNIFRTGGGSFHVPIDAE